MSLSVMSLSVTSLILIVGDKIKSSTHDGLPLPKTLVNPMWRLNKERNLLVHDRSYNSIADRQSFIQIYESVRQQLTALVAPRRTQSRASTADSCLISQLYSFLMRDKFIDLHICAHLCNQFSLTICYKFIPPAIVLVDIHSESKFIYSVYLKNFFVIVRCSNTNMLVTVFGPNLLQLCRFSVNECGSFIFIFVRWNYYVIHHNKSTCTSDQEIIL